MASNGICYPPLSFGSGIKGIKGTLQFSLFSDIYEGILGNQLFLKFVLPEKCPANIVSAALSAYYEIISKYIGIKKPNIVLELAGGWPVCFPDSETMTLEEIYLRIIDEEDFVKYCDLVTM